MSASNEPAKATQATQLELNDDLVREYLKRNHDFLQRNPDLLDHLHVSHASGSAISLVEKQVSVLRERNMDMRHRLTTLTGNARDNDRLYEQTRHMVLKLLEVASVGELYTTFVDGMRERFGVEHACMILYGEASGTRDCRVETLERARIEVGSLIRNDKGASGTLRAEELQFLFPDGGEVGSAALVPLSNGEPIGLIAVGSADAHRYSSGMGTLFLSHLADVIVRLLPRLPETAK